MYNSNLYIGFDRDETLELPNLEFDNTIAKQLRFLQENGAKLFLASGKGCEFLSEHFKQFNLTFDLICGENGGHIISEKMNFIKKCEKEHLDFFCKNIYSLELPYYENEPKESIWTGRFFENALGAARKIQAFIEFHELDLQVYLHPDAVDAVDVVPNVIDKVNVLEFIPNNAEIHFFGDGENYLSLMKHDRITPHTISNAIPAVKECVLAKNGKISMLEARDGVSELIDKLFLTKEVLCG